MKPELLAEAPQIIREFLGYLGTIKGKSEKTVEEYYLDLRTFFRYIKLSRNLVKDDTPFEEISISDVDIDLIRTITLTQVFEYMNYLTNVRNNKPATRSRKVSSLRTFFKYLTNKTNQLDVNPVLELETPKLRSSLPKYLTFEQSIDLLTKVDGKNKERDYCILVLFLNCGLRLSELVGINISNIDFSENRLTVIGKGNKERTIYLNNACVNAIKDYISVRPTEGVKNDSKASNKALFLSNRKERISNRTVQYIVDRELTKAGLDTSKYSTHKLRHTAATLMYQYGNVDIRALQELLGHESIATTEIYTHVSNEQVRNAVESNPLANL